MKQDIIKQYYNSQLTDKENIELLKEQGINISLSTLKRWRKKNGITKSGVSSENSKSNQSAK